MSPAVELQSKNLTGHSSKKTFAKKLLTLNLFGMYFLRMYDVDENGFIDLNEMTKLVRSIYQVSGAHQQHVFSPNKSTMNMISIPFVSETD